MLSDVRALGERVAQVFGAAMDETLSDRGRFTVALSRPTPQDVFSRVNEVRVPKRRIHLFQVDERAAKEGTDTRNKTLIERDLSRWVEMAEFHPMPVGEDGSGKSGKYEDVLTDVCGTPPGLDLVHLGLGGDGHTASLLRGDPVLQVDDAWVAPAKSGTPKRMTLTYPTLNAARLIVFVVSGKKKAAALRRVLNGDRSMPAAHLEAPNIRFYVDAEAASRL